jgi:N-acetylneuraminate synthase
MVSFNISGRQVGDDCPPLVIAEIGINHEGDIDVAIAMAESAIKSGAEVIKHQTHIVEDEMSEEAKAVIPGNADVSIYEIIKRCALSELDELKLMQHIQSEGSIFISTPFSRAAIHRLAKWDVPAYKIGSGECNNYPLIRCVAKIGKPIILSTGMNSIDSIRPAVEIFREYKTPFALLHCTNVYPTPFDQVRLGAMGLLKEAFPDAVVGLSDHTINNHTCLGAVALGASVLERHFTDSKDRPGPDIVCSMGPEDLSDLVQGAKNIFVARGGKKGPTEGEAPTIAFAFASVVVTDDLLCGQALTQDNLWLRRPGGGDFGAEDYDNLVGVILKKDIKKGSRLTKEHVE